MSEVAEMAVLGAFFLGGALVVYLARRYAQRRNDRLLNEGRGCLVAPAHQFTVGVGSLVAFGGFAGLCYWQMAKALGGPAAAYWMFTAFTVIGAALAVVGFFVAYSYLLYAVRMDESQISTRTFTGRWLHIPWNEVVSLEYEAERYVLEARSGAAVKVPEDIEGVARFAAVALEKVAPERIEEDAHRRLASKVVAANRRRRHKVDQNVEQKKEEARRLLESLGEPPLEELGEERDEPATRGPSGSQENAKPEQTEMGKILKNVARELSFGFWPALAMALLGGILEFGAILGFVKGDVGYEFWGFACLYMATFVLTVLNILKLIAAWLGTYEIINVESALVALVWVVLLLCIWHYPSAFEHWHALSNK